MASTASENGAGIRTVRTSSSLRSFDGEIDGPTEGAERRLPGGAGNGPDLVAAAVGVGGDAFALADEGGPVAALLEPVLVVDVADDVAVELVDAIEIGLTAAVEEIGRDIASVHQPRQGVAESRRDRSAGSSADTPARWVGNRGAGAGSGRRPRWGPR